MSVKNFLLTIALSIATTVTAQQADTAATANNAIYIADAGMHLHNLKNHTFVFIDSSNKLSVEEIALQPKTRFQPLNDSIIAQPYVTYWLRFSISAHNNIHNWWLILNGVQGYVDAWYLDSSNRVIEHQRTGTFVPRSEKKIKESPNLSRVSLTLGRGETKTIFLKVYNEYDAVVITTPQLRNPALGLPNTTSDIANSLRGGVMLAFSILSFFFFFFVKDKAYLLFGIYTLSLFFLYLIFHPDLPFLDWFIPEQPQLLMPAFMLFAPGGVLVFVFFGRYFINLQQLSKRIDTVYKWAAAIMVILLSVVITTMIVTHRTIPYAQYIYLVFILLFLVLLIRIAFFKSILVRIYVAGALWLVCFTILGLQSIVLLPYNPWIIGQMGQLFIYAAGLAYKIRLNEKARAEAQIVQLRNIELANLYKESEEQKEEIKFQKKTAEEALDELKATQSQLIQSEKMASLGELTAGIAHEIQNPLNFINNFSDVNKELIAEMKDELDKGNLEEVKGIATDIESNEEKINYHGKRADAIVKGMLQHSRKSSDKKEPTDINALVDEYLRLTYHGLRAKDKSFNAEFKTDFDQSIKKIEAVPQDIGRVLLNLFNNAFYAVGEKKKYQSDGYKPTVAVYTKKIGDKVQIQVVDNGAGIPKKVVDKIFQPFFTTKPAGQGTGLGLSLSYDIIKAHGGEIEVETKEGESTQFIITLPYTPNQPFL